VSHLNATNERITNRAKDAYAYITMSPHLEHMLAGLQPGLRSYILKVALDFPAINNPDTITQALQAHMVTLGTKADKRGNYTRTHAQATLSSLITGKQAPTPGMPVTTTTTPLLKTTPPSPASHSNQPVHDHTHHKDCAVHGPNKTHNSAKCSTLCPKLPSLTDSNAIIDHYNRTG
jgi:hypothetical protein